MRGIVLPLILTGLASANFATADEKTVLDDLRQPIGSLSLKEAIVIRSREGEPLRKPEKVSESGPMPFLQLDSSDARQSFPT